MKANLKGMGGPKAILLLHGEKIVIGVVALLALWFVYSSLSLPKLDAQYQASELGKRITEANAMISGTEWPARDSELASEVRWARELEKKLELAVDPKKYDGNPGRLNPPVVAATMLRTDPPVLNAVEVRANGGSGLFAFIDDDVMKAFQLREKRRQDELQKKQEDQMKRQEQMRGEAQRQQRGGRRGGEPEVLGVDFDPENPHRRLIEGVTATAGVPVQGGERIEQAHWAVVVAKVPIREQLRRHEDAFENARGGYDPQRDFPRYFGYIVRRAEVVRGKPLQWEPVYVYDGQRKSVQANKPVFPKPNMNMEAMRLLEAAAQQNWAGGGPMPEVVPQHYTDYVLTFPLPPLVGREWGADATHPDIPLAIHAPPLEPELAPEVAAQQGAVPPAESDDELGLPATDLTQSPYGPSAPAAGRPPAFMPREMGGRVPFGSFSREMGGRFPGPGPGPEGGARSSYAAGARSTGQATTLPRGVDFWLLRFFDFSVEPGKKYKYQVKLVMVDPNYDAPRETLAGEVHDRLAEARKKRAFYRIADDWSEPSPTVGIPLAGGVRVADVRPKSDKVHNDEPLARMLVESIDVDKRGLPIQGSPKDLKEFRRGSVANSVEEAWYVESEGRYINRVDAFKFQTGVTLLDVKGGERLWREINSPARVLLMGPAGQLYIRNELDDRSAIENHRMLFGEMDRRRRGEEDLRGPYGPGPESGGFPGPGGRRLPRR